MLAFFMRMLRKSGVGVCLLMIEEGVVSTFVYAAAFKCILAIHNLKSSKLQRFSYFPKIPEHFPALLPEKHPNERFKMQRLHRRSSTSRVSVMANFFQWLSLLFSRQRTKEHDPFELIDTSLMHSLMPSN